MDDALEHPDHVRQAHAAVERSRIVAVLRDRGRAVYQMGVDRAGDDAGVALKLMIEADVWSEAAELVLTSLPP